MVQWLERPPGKREIAGSFPYLVKPMPLKLELYVYATSLGTQYLKDRTSSAGPGLGILRD